MIPTSFRFSGDDIILCLVALLCLLVLFWSFVAAFGLSCIPGEHFMIKLTYFYLEEIYCPDCGVLLYSVPRCSCGNICRHDFCPVCGLEQ